MNRLLQKACLVISFFFVVSCVSTPTLQPQVNSLVVAGRFNYALKLLEEQKASYGENNHLLYLLDYGLALHIAGNYSESVKKFEEAKAVYDSLYTTSVSKQFKTWLINDYYAPYRGEDFERVLINVFQAINFVMMGDSEGALVDARDVNETLKLINGQYKDGEKNVYREDGFARLLMGIFYEHKGTPEGINDAFISNKKAFEIYESDYFENYDVLTPKILKENLLATAKFMGEEVYKEYRAKFDDISVVALKERKEMAEVYLFYYFGLSPIKHQISFPIPLPNGYVTKLAFPYYDKRDVKNEPSMFKAVNNESKIEYLTSTELTEDITAIARQNLENRRARVLAKAVLRAGGKYVLEQQLEDNLRENFGSGTGDVFRYLASLYNISSEQADLRSWQTLPGEIRLARLWLKPGTYSLYAGDRFLGSVALKSGSKEYFVVRTTR